MADIDSKLIGQIVDSIDLGKSIAAQLAGVVEAQRESAESAMNFLLNVGFEEDPETGKKKTINVSITYDEKDSNGDFKSRSLTVPQILLVNIPQIEIERATITWDLEVSQSAFVKDSGAFEGKGEGKLGWGIFSVGLSVKGSYSKEQTRKTDTRAKQHLEIIAKQAEPPEAVNMIMEILRNASMGASMPKLPENRVKELSES